MLTLYVVLISLAVATWVKLLEGWDAKEMTRIACEVRVAQSASPIDFGLSSVSLGLPPACLHGILCEVMMVLLSVVLLSTARVAVQAFL